MCVFCIPPAAAGLSGLLSGIYKINLIKLIFICKKTKDIFPAVFGRHLVICDRQEFLPDGYFRSQVENPLLPQNPPYSKYTMSSLRFLAGISLFFLVTKPQLRNVKKIINENNIVFQFSPRIYPWERNKNNLQTV